MWLLAEFLSSGPIGTEYTTGMSPGSPTCWLQKGYWTVVSLGTKAEVSDGALKPERGTWAVCHHHKHTIRDTWQYGSRGWNITSQDPADSHDIRRVQFRDTPKSKSFIYILYLYSESMTFKWVADLTRTRSI